MASVLRKIRRAREAYMAGEGIYKKQIAEAIQAGLVALHAA